MFLSQLESLLAKKMMYGKGWNFAVIYLRKTPSVFHDRALEYLRDTAHRNLLMGNDVDASQAVLDCTGEFIASGKENIPQPYGEGYIHAEGP